MSKPIFISHQLNSILRFCVFLLLTNQIYAEKHVEFCEANSSIVYVNSSASLGGNGKSWSEAFKYLQDAIKRAEMLSNEGLVEIWVAQGTYFPDLDEGGSVMENDQNASFYLINNVSILGGFTPSMDKKSQRNWNDYPTILSGAIDVFSSYHVIKNDNSPIDPLNSSALLSGFIVEESSASRIDLIDQNQGGGIFNRHSSPLITYCRFRSNQAYHGAAIFNDKSSPIFKNCIIEYNSAWSYGDVAYNTNRSKPEFHNCTITNNEGPNSNFSDTSIFNVNSDIIIKNCILWDNTIEIINRNSNPTVSNSIIKGGYSGGTNIINANPNFIDQNNNYRLSLCSPGINHGSNIGINEILDFSLNKRIQHDVIDAGAYEYNSKIIYVKHDAIGADNGTSWTNAYDKLQDALHTLSNCNSPAIIWVAKGTYYSDEGLGQVNNLRQSSFKMLPHVEIYGGFVGNETSFNQRNYENHQTFLSGDLKQNDDQAMIDDNAFHVINNERLPQNPLGEDAILDGFIIKGGAATDTLSTNLYGGGMLNIYSSPTITNCTFIDNTAHEGGAMYNLHSNIDITNVDFFNNEVISLRENDILFNNLFKYPKGGAIYHNYGEFKTTKCNFSFNSCLGLFNSLSFGGGAIWISKFASFQADNCIFDSNRSSGKGGALHIEIGTEQNNNIQECSFEANSSREGGAIYSAGKINFSKCTFEKNYHEPGIYNTPSLHGGAILAFTDTITIDSCSFLNNKGDHYGGALALDRSVGYIMNSTFDSNSVEIFNCDLGNECLIVLPSGGAVFVDVMAEASINNCSFLNNFSLESGGAIYNKSDNLDVSNCLFWNNLSSNGGLSIYNDNGDAEFINCTFANNNTNSPRVHLANSNSSEPVLKNCILWKKLFNSNMAVSIQDLSGSTTTGYHCIIQGGWGTGANILDTFPEFVDLNNGDLRVRSCSPAINYGNNFYSNSQFDLDGNLRIFTATQSRIVDLGPYEYQGEPTNNCCPIQLNLTGQIASGTYEASSSIICNGTIPAGNVVIFNAPDSIVLQTILI